MSLPSVNREYLVAFLAGLLETPSPTGYAQRAIAYIEEALSAYPALNLTQTRKGALVAEWPGQRSDAPRALTAHTDS
jgi:putative aminopeptidase FrvX